MPKIKAFTLFELIIVVIIIGIVSFLVLKLPVFSNEKIKKIENLRDILYPNGQVIITDKKIISSKKIDIKITNPKIFIFKDNMLIQKNLGEVNNSKILFKYQVKNGIGDSFILKCDEGIYIFKPFYIKKVLSLNEAKNKFLNIKYQPKYGSYY